MSSCVYQIKKMYHTFTFSQKKLMDYVIQHQENIIQMPIAELAEQVGISSATIITAVRKLGFAGYSDFKLSLASEPKNLLSPLMPPQGEEDVPDSTLCEIVDSNCEALQLLKSEVISSQLHEAAKLLVSAHHVHIFGEGTSSNLVVIAHEFLTRLGIPCSHERDWQFKVIQAENMRSDDVALFISLMGVNIRAIELAKRVQKHACKSIGISNYRKCALAKQTNLFLAPFSGPITCHSNDYSLQLPIICLLETLHRIILNMVPEKFDSMKRIYEQLGEAENSGKFY